MAVANPTPACPARAYSVRGEPQDVKHRSGDVVVPREGVVVEEKHTFLDLGGARQISDASVTFLEHVSVEASDLISLPGGKPRPVLKVIHEYAQHCPTPGYLTTARLGSETA